MLIIILRIFLLASGYQILAHYAEGQKADCRMSCAHDKNKLEHKLNQIRVLF